MIKALQNNKLSHYLQIFYLILVKYIWKKRLLILKNND